MLAAFFLTRRREGTKKQSYYENQEVKLWRILSTF